MVRTFVQLIILLALPLMFGGCATSTRAPDAEATVQRDPAGDGIEQRAQDAIAKKPDANLWLRQQLSKVTDNFFSAATLLRKFDQQLESARSTAQLFGSPTYAKLLFLKSQRTEIYQPLLDHHRALLKATGTKAGREALGAFYEVISEFQTLADEAIAAVSKKTATDTAKLALSELIERFDEHRAEVLGSRDTSSSAREHLEHDVFAGLKVPDELLQEIAGVEGDRRIASESMSSEAGELHQELSALYRPARNRAPQAKELRILPSAGPKGNITGENFPKGVWALTYDDGPSSRHTPAVLANLKKHGIKATFFVVADMLKAQPSIGHAQRDQGHGLANHSYTHAQLTRLGTLGIEREVRDSTTAQTDIWGQRPRFFRCPYGSGTNTTRIREVIAREKMIHVFWNADSFDWQDKNPKSVFDRTVKQMKLSKGGGGVILYHDIHAQSVIATEMLMKYFNDNRLRAVTLPEIVDEINAMP